MEALGIPDVTTSADGRTVSWDPVAGATYYRIMWYPLKDGVPYESGGPLRETGRIYNTSLTLTDPVPGTYAIRLDAHERCSGATVNRSTLYKRHVIPPLITDSIKIPEIKEGRLASSTAWDYYEFKLGSQTEITISLISTDFDTCLILRNDAGTTYEISEDATEIFGIRSTNSQISLSLNEGRYFAWVLSRSGNGAYVLVTRDIGNNDIESICAWRERDYPALYRGLNYDINQNNWETSLVLVGGKNCTGRCGVKCPGDGTPNCGGAYNRYTRDCLNHDACVGSYGHVHCWREAKECEDDCLYAKRCGGPYHIDPYLGTCDGKTPCYSKIQGAIDAADSGTTIKILRGTYDEALNLSRPVNIVLEGGWGADYKSQTPNTTFIRAPKVILGAVTLRMLTIKPE
ncbi:MAG: hypothetical protein R6U38_03165 [Desulfatiglandaceae bacterium]